MLSAIEIKEINAELNHSVTRASACVDALNIVQRRRGWVSDEALKDIASHLGMTPDELEAIATFYSFIFRRQVGRHVILICDSISCWVMGYNPLIDVLKATLNICFGETTADRRFTLLPITCLGACDRAPAMMVDDELYGPVTPEMMDAVLSKYK